MRGPSAVQHGCLGPSHLDKAMQRARVLLRQILAAPTSSDVAKEPLIERSPAFFGTASRRWLRWAS